MRGSIHILLMVITLLAGCRKDETLLDGDIFVGSSEMIGFSGSESSATKSTILTDTNFSSMEVFALYTAHDQWSKASSVASYMSEQSVTREITTNLNTEGEITGYTYGSWGYSPAKYWPADTEDKITFFAFAPDGVITHTYEEDSGKPIFSYTLSNLASENEDLSADVCLDETNASNSVDFEFDHMLTKLMLYAQTTGVNPDAGTNETYIINGISIIGLQPTRTLNIADDGTMSWSSKDNTQETIELVAAQGVTLESKEDYALDSYDSDTDIDYYTDIMADGKAIFVLPQSLLTSAGETTPQVQLRIRRAYKVDDTTVEVIYQTAAVDIPTTTITEWKMGQEIALYFTFDISRLSEYDTPLTVVSDVLPWTDVTIDVDMHSNLYIYSSLSDIIAETETETATDGTVSKYGEFMICTNYDYNLRVPHHRVELDGEITSSRGFLFCSDYFTADKISGATTYHVGTIDGYSDYKIFVPTLLDQYKNEVVYVSEDNLIDYSYTYSENIDEFDNNDGSYTLDDGSIIYFGDNGYAYHLNTKEEATDDIIEGLYRLLYYDTSGKIAIFDYKNDTDTGYHEIDLSNFADDEGTVYFKIKIMEDYEFDFSVGKTTREEAGLYTSTAIGDSDDDDIDDDISYGINKKGSDAVYTLRLSVNSDHLKDAGGEFDDIIGVEMVSNGGGMITQLFPVTLTDPTATTE